MTPNLVSREYGQLLTHAVRGYGPVPLSNERTL